MTGASLAAGTAAYATVVHTVPSGAPIVVSGSSTPIDLNGDAVVDFLLTQGFGIFPLDVGQYTYGNYALGAGAFLSALSASVSVGGTATNFIYDNRYWNMYDGSLYSGPWAGGTHAYLGLRFDIGGASHHGWARVSVAQDGLSASLHEFAYENVAGAPILTGQTSGGASPVIPEPSTFALMAMGATTALAFRRVQKRRKKAANGRAEG